MKTAALVFIGVLLGFILTMTFITNPVIIKYEEATKIADQAISFGNRAADIAERWKAKYEELAAQCQTPQSK